ncbi:hypothetical protein BH11MYX4_BH11MYX4_02380 [soil metagenome]
MASPDLALSVPRAGSLAARPGTRHHQAVKCRRVAWLFLATAAGCSLTTDLDGYSSGGLAPVDAGTDVAIVADAGADAPPPIDGATVVDAGFSCAALSPAPRLCVDFGSGRLDSAGTPTATDFQSQLVVGAAAPQLDTAVFASAPASARFDLGPMTTRAFLSRTFPVSTPGRIELAMSMRIEGPTDTRVDLMEMRFGNVDASIYLSVNGTSTSVTHAYRGGGDGGYTADATRLSQDLPRDRWTRVALVVETGASPTLSVSLDGALLVSKKALAAFTSADGVTFIAGYTDAATNGKSLRVWVDDVVADF